MNNIPQHIPGAEPRFFRGNKIGCLVVHGFMAAPPETAWLGEHLAQLGYTVYVPRLPGHGIDYHHMRRMHWHDWYAHVLDSYLLLRQQCDAVFVIGHSMGGVLSLMLAAQEQPTGVVAAAVPVQAATPLMRYIHLVDRVRPFMHFGSDPVLDAAIEAEQQQRNERVVSRVRYDNWSVNAIRQLYLAMQQAHAVLPQVSVPLLLLYARNDTTVPLQNQEIVRQRVNSNDLSEVVLEEGDHIIFQDVAREAAFKIVSDWLAERS